VQQVGKVTTVIGHSCFYIRIYIQDTLSSISYQQSGKKKQLSKKKVKEIFSS